MQTLPVSTAEEAKVTLIFSIYVFITLFQPHFLFRKMLHTNQRQQILSKAFPTLLLIPKAFFLSDHFQVLLFLLDLQGEPKGLSIGGLLVISKSTSLAVRPVIFILFSFFSLMVELSLNLMKPLHILRNFTVW